MSKRRRQPLRSPTCNAACRSTPPCFSINLFFPDRTADPPTRARLMSGRNLPFIGIPCCVRAIWERPFHTVNDRYPQAVIDAMGGVPVLIPAVGAKLDLGAVLDRLDGLLI